MSTSDGRRGRAMRFVPVGNVVVELQDARGQPEPEPEPEETPPQPDPDLPTYEDGYAAGLQAAQAQHQAEVARLQQQLATVGQQIPAALATYLKQLEQQIREEVCALSLQLAEQIVRVDARRRDQIRHVIDAALAPLLNPHGVKLHCHPEVAHAIASGASDLALSADVMVVPDAGLQPGEALVDSDEGRIDATVAGRLQALRETFLAHLENLEHDDAADA